MNELPALRVQAFHERIANDLGLSRKQIAVVHDALEETIGADIRRLGGVPCPKSSCDRLMTPVTGAFSREVRLCPEHGYVDGPFDLLIAFPPVVSR